MGGTVDLGAKFLPASHKHNFWHNRTIFRVTLKNMMVKIKSMMCLTLACSLPYPQWKNRHSMTACSLLHLPLPRIPYLTMLDPEDVTAEQHFCKIV